MEESDTNETYVDFVEGVQFDSGLKSPHLITDKDKGTAVLDDPYVLIVSSPIPNIRKIQSVLEHVIKSKRSLLIVAKGCCSTLATISKLLFDFITCSRTLCIFLILGIGEDAIST